MRRHLFGKDHKQAKSLKLQKKLQEEEDAKWAEELERRKEQERLDEEFARKLQEELEQQQGSEQQQHSSPTSPQVQPSSPATPITNHHTDPSTPPPLPSKPRAYASSSSSQTGTARASQPAAASSSSSASSSLERPPAAAYPTAGSSNLTSSPADTLPPPYAVHGSHHIRANSSEVSPPSLPPRQSTPTPAPPGSYPPPSASGFANMTPAPATQPQERPITAVSHGSSFSSPMAPPTTTYPQQQQQPSTTSYQPSTGSSQQPPIFSHANASVTNAMNGVSASSYPATYPNVTSSLPQQQSYSPIPANAVPHQQQQQQQQQSTTTTTSPPHHPPPQQSYTPMPVPHVENIVSSGKPGSSSGAAARPDTEQQQQQQQPPIKYPSEPSMGATLFGQHQQHQLPPPRREPMMFVPPPHQAASDHHHATPPTPATGEEQHRYNSHPPARPQSRQYMSMPIPDPAGYRASPRQQTATPSRQQQQQQGTATHVSPLDSISLPTTIDVAPKSPSSTSMHSAQRNTTAASDNDEKPQAERKNSSNIDYFDSSSSNPVIPRPVLQPQRVGNMVPKKKKKNRAVAAAPPPPQETYKPDEPDPFADDFAVAESSSHEEEEEQEEQKDYLVNTVEERQGKNRNDENEQYIDKGKARKHDTEDEEEEEEEQPREIEPTKDQHTQHDVDTKKKDDELPEGFNPADYFDDHDLVDLNAPSDYGSSDDDGSSCDEDHVTEEKAEVTAITTTKRPKSMGYATRIEPGASMIDLSSFNKNSKDKEKQRSDYIRNRRRSESASPSVSDMQERLADLLVNASWSEEKTQETPEIVHTPMPTLSHSRSRSMSSLFPHPPHPDGSQVSLHLPPPSSGTPYMPPVAAQAPYPMSRAGTPYMVHGGNVYMDQRYIRDVPSNEYGYYRVQPDQTQQQTNSNNVSGSNENNDKTKSEDKQLPKIPKSDPNHRHITVPSINPGQRVWIRVKPTDTGRDLANRIHIVATYKTRKILKITTTSGTDVPIDDTPVFEDWNEIEKLQDGAPWKVEWGPMDRDLFGGRQLLRHIKAGFRAAGKE